MKRSLAPFVVALGSLLAACGSSSSDEASTQARPVVFDGVFRPEGAGEIGTLAFSNNKDYLLMPSGCSQQSCSEIGTFTYDAERSELTLVNAVSGAKRTFAIQVLKTIDNSLVKTSSLHPMGDLIDNPQPLTPGGQSSLTPGGQSSTLPGGQSSPLPGGQSDLTTGLAQQLIQMVQQFMAAAQEMKKDQGNQNDQGGQNGNNDNGNKNDNQQHDPACAAGMPGPNTPLSQAAAYWARCPNGP